MLSFSRIRISLVLLLLLISSIFLNDNGCLAADNVPKICPDEPVVAPGTPCPAVCDSCQNGVCIINNPTQNVTCPDHMSCLVFCVSFDYGPSTCSQLTVKCSTTASCDIFVQRIGAVTLSVDCQDSPFSCAVMCDSVSSIWTMGCDPSISCNCFSSCPQEITCQRGINCPGDPCFTNFAQFKQDYCIHPSLSRALYTPSSSLFSPFYYCRNESMTCAADVDCGFPTRGYCNVGLRSECICFNPYGGPGCQQHLCPHCQNQAFCGNSTADACVCTGAWTGPNCTEPLVLSYLPNAPAHCTAAPSTAPNALMAAPTETPPVTACPAPCARCPIDNDGTPVCIVVFPLPYSPVSVTAACPKTHRCVFHCMEGKPCVGTLSCSGDLPCDLVNLSPKPIPEFNCTSRSICRVSSGNLVSNQFEDPQKPLHFEIDLGCTHSNDGPCLCEDTSHFYIPCRPGVNCAGDLCHDFPCSADSIVVFNNVTDSCECRCLGIYHQVGAVCQSLNITLDCVPSCQNGGMCKDGRCWCPPGKSGPDCSTIDSCVALPSTTCPSGCKFCDQGVCFFTLSTFSADDPAVCPVGWPCVFICDKGPCLVRNSEVVCPAGSGPCELWCWSVTNVVTYAGIRLTHAEGRVASNCANITMRCASEDQGCRARCAPAVDSSVYNQVRTVRGIHCGSHSVNETSPTALDSCSPTCGTDSCYIAEADPCYTIPDFPPTLYLTGFVQACPTDLSSNWLQPHPNFEAGTCECDCETGFQLVNGTCSAIGCEPICKNNGRCMPQGDSFVCICISGYAGKDCTSRCHFPVSANVTSCQNGIYQISGAVVVANTQVDLYKDVQDLIVLEIDGSLLASGNSSISFDISAANLTSSSLKPSVTISNNLTVSDGSSIQSNIVVQNGQAVTTKLDVSGTVTLSPGAQYRVSANATEIRQLIASSGSGDLKLDLLTFGSSNGEVDAVIDFVDAEIGASCRRLTASTSNNLNSNNRRTALSVLFSIDESQCTSADNSVAIGVGVGITVGIVVAASASILIAAYAVPSFRYKIFPFLKSRSSTAGSNQQHLEVEENQPTPSTRDSKRWMLGSKPIPALSNDNL